MKLNNPKELKERIKFCYNCGRELNEHERICLNCKTHVFISKWLHFKTIEDLEAFLNEKDLDPALIEIIISNLKSKGIKTDIEVEGVDNWKEDDFSYRTKLVSPHNDIKFCHHCGKQRKSREMLCSNCGKFL